MDGRVGVKPLQQHQQPPIQVPGPGRGAGGEFTLPQIHSKAYGHNHHQYHIGSNVSSGHVSMATSNKSTSHGRFLPAIYNKTPPKVTADHFSFNMHEILFLQI